MSVEWDAVNWSNTHMNVSDGQYHLGVVEKNRGRFLAIGVGTDCEAQIMLLSKDEIDDLLKWIRQEAKRL